MVPGKKVWIRLGPPRYMARLDCFRCLYCPDSIWVPLVIKQPFQRCFYIDIRIFFNSHIDLYLLEER